MAIRAIVQHPDPILRVGCAPVVDFDDTLRALAADMFDTMYAAQGRGLAAPQVGITCRLFVTDAGWKSGQSTAQVWVNPQITWVSDGRQVHEEACLSIADIGRRIARPAQVMLCWQDVAGARHEGRVVGMDAVIAQHEIDHLDGILMIDHAAAILPPDLKP